jgi:CBS domain-containing protein
MMTLEQELQHERVNHLDLSNFIAVEIGTSVKTVVEAMRAQQRNCAIVTDQGSLVGIFTDHDVLIKVADNPDTWQLPIDDFITLAPLTVKATDPVDKALALMNKKHFRNVPVLDETGQVVGNLTHYAIIQYLADRFPESVYNLPPDPERTTRRRNGA